MKVKGKFLLNHSGIKEIIISVDPLGNPILDIGDSKLYYIEQLFENYPSLLSHKKGILNKIANITL